MKAYIVWNAAKTEGFVTVDDALAYEVRKSATDNCYDREGTPSKVGMTFTEEWWEDACTIQEVEV